MKFGSVKLAEAEGAILAHSMRAGQPPYEAQLCYRIPKGTPLTAQHLADLAAEGHHEITVARLEQGDLHEDAAALALAQALVPDEAKQGIRISGAGAGRVNLYALGAGLVRLDHAALEALNDVDPMITIAPVPDYHRVDADGMIATIKIISYGVEEAALLCAGAGAAGALHVLPPVFTTASLVETRVSRETPADKGRRAMAGRLHRMGLSLSDRVVVPHREAELAKALEEAPGEVLFDPHGLCHLGPDGCGAAGLAPGRGQCNAFWHAGGSRQSAFSWRFQGAAGHWPARMRPFARLEWCRLGVGAGSVRLQGHKL